MTVAVRPDILSGLQSVRQDVERRIATLDRFRALKAIEQTMVDFPGLDDLSRSLSEIRDRIRAQLDETREFRALRSLERMMPELSEVLALVEYAPAAGGEDAAAVSAAVEPHPGASQRAAVNETGPDTSRLQIAGGGPADQVAAQAHHSPVVDERAGVSDAGTEEGTQVQDRPSKPESHMTDVLSPEAGPTETLPPGTLPSEAATPETEVEHVPSLVDSVAQLMAQSMAPQREAHAPPVTHPQERSDLALTHAERAA